MSAPQEVEVIREAIYRGHQVDQGFDYQPADSALDSLVARLEVAELENDRFMSQNRDFKVTVDALAAALAARTKEQA